MLELRTKIDFEGEDWNGAYKLLRLNTRLFRVVTIVLQNTLNTRIVSDYEYVLFGRRPGWLGVRVHVWDTRYVGLILATGQMFAICNNLFGLRYRIQTAFKKAHDCCPEIVEIL